MPRKARIDAPGALHHVIVRGINKRIIFKDNLDRDDFLGRLGGLVSETETKCFAWALMPNHVHLLLRTGWVPVAKLMQRLLTGYAVRFNRRHRRHGHLYQNRYKSILCEADAYLKELVRYIHLNPLRADLVADLKELNSHPYTGHSALMGHSAPIWQSTDAVLRLFGNSTSKARHHYFDFVSKGISEGRRPDLTGGGLVRSVGGWQALKKLRRSGSRVKGDERILGGTEFVEQILNHAGEDFDLKYRIHLARPDLPELIEKTADFFNIAVRDLETAGKNSALSRARAALCHLAVKKFMYRCVDVSRALHLSQSTVSKAIGRWSQMKDRAAIEERLLKEFSG
jgi:putative transposase